MQEKIPYIITKTKTKAQSQCNKRYHTLKETMHLKEKQDIPCFTFAERLSFYRQISCNYIISLHIQRWKLDKNVLQGPLTRSQLGH